MGTLDELLRSCTVRVVAPPADVGSGAFVAPGCVLTCAHVVEQAWNAGTAVTVVWAGRALPAEVAAFHPAPFPDLALLRLLPVEPTVHPWVLAGW